MANAWKIAGIGWAITLSIWVLSPIIGLLLNKIRSYLGFDASQKLRELEIHTVPKLKLKLREVEEQRMLKEARKEISDANTLDMLASRLKHSLYEAEDILDLRDYHRIEKMVGDVDSSWHWWVQHLDGAVGTCKTIWLGVNFTRGRAALQWAQSLLYRSSAILPISCAPSISLVQRLRCWSRPFDFNNFCRFISNWLARAYEVARFYRNWSYDVVGITSYQEGGTTSDDAPLNMPKSGLKKSLEKIEKIINEAEEVFQRLNRGQTAAANSRGLVTTAAPPLEVFGRDKDRDNIISMLHDGQSTSKGGLCYSVIGIHGISGSGKSTLAQLVCDREKKEQQEKKRGHFNFIMWVHVCQNFCVDTIFRNMLEEVTGKPCPQFSSRNTLQGNLEEELRGKRFLLVLDDVWYDKDVSHQQELRQILSPLRVGGAGSKILVTSRTEDALIYLGAVKRIAIPDLDETFFLELFMHYALGFAMVNDQVRSILEPIGEDIAKKLKRSPLAAIAVGGQLRTRPEVEFWRSARDGDLLNETMGALWWSYQHFDEQVRRCFAYCSMFPRRHRLKRDELVNLWVAEGFIKMTEAGENMEDIARVYFCGLVSTSFLPRQKDYRGRDYYTIHDLLHDLVEKVAGSDCFRIENGWTGKVPPDIRHLFVTTCNRELITQEISKLENLRTLIIDDNAMEEAIEDKHFECMFTGLRKLRTLKVRIRMFQGHFEVPASLGQLKHIRYLSIKTRYFLKLSLPSTFTKLYHMQVLDFGSCTELVFYPGQDLSNLINLRHILTLDELNLPNITRLTSLQTLPLFGVRKEQGYELRHLKHLNKLRGLLGIYGLENVGSKEEALEANLAGKAHLTKLEFWWGKNRLQSCNADLEADILEGLCPPMQLKTLEINFYDGSRYPDWMVDNKNGPKKLQQLLLHKCSPLVAIPGRNEFFVHLRELIILDCSWDALPNNMEHLMSLKILRIDGCRNIRSLPTLPQSLEVFRLWSCSDEFRRSCQTIGDPNWQKIQHIANKIFQQTAAAWKWTGADEEDVCSSSEFQSS